MGLCLYEREHTRLEGVGVCLGEVCSLSYFCIFGFLFVVYWLCVYLGLLPSAEGNIDNLFTVVIAADWAAAL